MQQFSGCQITFVLFSRPRGRGSRCAVGRRNEPHMQELMNRKRISAKSLDRSRGRRTPAPVHLSTTSTLLHKRGYCPVTRPQHIACRYRSWRALRVTEQGSCIRPRKGPGMVRPVANPLHSAVVLNPAIAMRESQRTVALGRVRKSRPFRLGRLTHNPSRHADHQ